MKYTYVKVRHAKSEEVKIKFVSDSEERSTHMETEISADTGASPDFVSAMKALKPHFLEILDLDEEYGADLEVHTLSFQHRDDRWSVVMSGSKKVAAAKGPFNPSTPRLAQPKDNDGYGKVGIVSRDLEEKILAVIKQADAFRQGERAQQELELDSTQQARTGRGKEADTTPIEAAAQNGGPELVKDDEPEEKSYRAGEIPADEDDELPWEAKPLTSFDKINPTLISILGREGITNTAQLRDRRDDLGDIKGIGAATLQVLDDVLLSVYGSQPKESAGEAMPV